MASLVTWETDTETRNKEGEVKTAKFRAARLAVIDCPSFTGGSATFRPVWAVLGGTDSTMRAFLANARLGKKIEPANTEIRTDRIEFLKSVGFKIDIQRPTNDSVVATIYRPDLFTMDPGMLDPEAAKFIVVVPSEWDAEVRKKLSQEEIREACLHVLRQNITKSLNMDHLESMVPTAILFNGYLDRRTRCPLIPTLKFQLQVFVSALKQGLARFPASSWSYSDGKFGFSSSHVSKFLAGGMENVGTHTLLVPSGLKNEPTTEIHACVAFRANHDDLETFFAKEVKAYFS